MAIIRVSGPPRSGKTTACDLLAPRIGYINYYTGRIFETLAEEHFNIIVDTTLLDPTQVFEQLLAKVSQLI